MITTLLSLLACSSPTPAPPATPVPEPPAAEATPLPPEPTPQPTPAGPPKPPRALPEGALSEHLRPDERFAHATFLGPLGPSPELSFAVVQRENTLYAWVLPGEHSARVDGPALHDEWAAYEVAAVMFPTVAEQRVAVVLAQCITGVGPTGAEPFPCNAALRWDGAALTRDAELERTLATARTAIDVRKALP